jgi:DNA invertase Pin-like site-specific DNA recombinase
MMQIQGNNGVSSETPFHVAIYARVSTSDQDASMQVAELHEYCRRKGWHHVTDYVDTGWSGAKSSRPELNRLMSDVRLGKVGCILTWKLDRLARSLAHLVQTIQELDSLGVRFVAVTQNIDTSVSNPMSRFMLQIFGAFAELEREMIRERVTAGVRNAKRKGIQLGRKRVVFDRSKAMDMHETGASIKTIAAELGVGAGTIHRALAAFQKPADLGVSQVDDSAASVRP